jgi:hypothetical protein
MDVSDDETGVKVKVLSIDKRRGINGEERK